MIHDLRQVLRAFRRTPIFVLSTVLVLALGIGANTAVFSVVYAVLLKPLPYADPDRLVRLSAAMQITWLPSSGGSLWSGDYFAHVLDHALDRPS